MYNPHQRQTGYPQQMANMQQGYPQQGQPPMNLHGYPTPLTQGYPQPMIDPVQQQMMAEREAMRQMKRLGNLQRKQAEIMMGGQFPQEMKIPRLTKPVAEEFISRSLGIPQARLKYIKVLEDIHQMRHACMQGGVQIQPINTIYYTNIPIKLGVCSYCGTVHYHYDLGEGSQPIHY